MFLYGWLYPGVRLQIWACLSFALHHFDLLKRGCANSGGFGASRFETVLEVPGKNCEHAPVMDFWLLSEALNSSGTFRGVFFSNFALSLFYINRQGNTIGVPVPGPPKICMGENHRYE